MGRSPARVAIREGEPRPWGCKFLTGAGLLGMRDSRVDGTRCSKPLAPAHGPTSAPSVRARASTGGVPASGELQTSLVGHGDRLPPQTQHQGQLGTDPGPAFLGPLPARAGSDRFEPAQVSVQPSPPTWQLVVMATTKWRLPIRRACHVRPLRERGGFARWTMVRVRALAWAGPSRGARAVLGVPPPGGLWPGSPGSAGHRTHRPGLS